MNSIYIVTWNVLNLLKPGKMQELVEQIANTQLEIVAIQETRLNGNSLIKRNNYSLWI
jgi:exonuclease III